MPVPTNDTSEIIRYCFKGLQSIYKKGLKYKKAGIMLKELLQPGHGQKALFDSRDRKRFDTLMQSIDEIDNRMGKSTLKFAACGVSPHPKWETVFHCRSPAYTAHWEKLLKVS